MSTTFFSDPGVITDLLAVCRAEGLLTSKTENNVRVLLDQGLHPEQVLLGTGLVSVSQYGEVLEQVFGVPFIRRASSSRGSEALIEADVLVERRAVFVEHRSKTAIVAFADPSDREAIVAIEERLRLKGVALTPAVTLWSDMRSLRRMPRSIGTVHRLLRREWQRIGVQAFEVGHGPGRDAHLHLDARDLSSSSLRSAELSAFDLHVDRKQQKGVLDWDMDHSYLSHGVMMSGRRSVESFALHHPLGWSQTVKLFFQQPSGVLVCIGADASWGSFLHTQDLLRAKAFSRDRAVSRPVLYDLRSADPEEALHAVVAGRPTVLAASAFPAWLSEVAAVGIPVRVVERHAVPAGMSWSSYSL